MSDAPVEHPQFCKLHGSSSVGSPRLCESHQAMASNTGRLAEKRATLSEVPTGLTTCLSLAAVRT